MTARLTLFYVTLNNSQNILELNVYLQDINIVVMKQQPAYSTESLFGKSKLSTAHHFYILPKKKWNLVF